MKRKTESRRTRSDLGRREERRGGEGRRWDVLRNGGRKNKRAEEEINCRGDKK